MKDVVIFGKRFSIVERRSDSDFVEVKERVIVVNRKKRTARSLLKEFLAEKLYSRLIDLYEEMMKCGKVEVLGDLDFEIVGSIDNKRRRIAKLKGNKILVRLNAVALPEPALKYIIAHEVAHIFNKRHTKRFWRMVESIYPEYEVGLKLLREYEELL
ncbi:MAG: hypothetical protein DRN53_01405 [Thermoprotei archaeon]|nr:MAG: hypothetical protein DRN53_01405 [Thermoprotei archaeon]